ncbi:MAG: hypothetical protein A2271_04920 [Candidatus Moranbacteria bacterium RIFOXYA12_FULL_35_19]|nr:MAG: ATP-binding transport protein NatA [Candidatus Moranbacteria bacterium GW2011_GWF2_35_39]OGI30856.1 MAG: hypothetical protein A2343_00410 [Candidatus Moranbacteria bacterium RIFOXYB12_FULL_35_8]OGI33086.1 MAG: hypothetical protein A2489_03315 [Candidatus Moranbacteria bacterium RIFOXYC12_FULL_36_13]OGI35778.1 MAG: hypothetical protein A2271_04920 [Candidatus Moranbacteria bacterium RIFOXYA12_FULL_35_19]
MAIIAVKNLSKIYFSSKKEPGILAGIKNLFNPDILEIKAVEDINFEIEEGEFVGFLGPNGAGKTTTLKMLSGIIKPTSGSMSVMGFDPWEKKNEYKRQFALLMGQKNQLWWDLPVMESFLLNKEIYDIPDDQFERTLDELSELLDIKKILNIQVRKLSLGERMKCELVASLLHSPKVLFLDEPTIGLDVVAQKNIRDFLKKYNQEKKTTIILTSHYMEDIEKLCKRIIIINQEIFYDGLLSDLIEKYAKNKILQITFNDPVEEKDIKKFGLDYKFNPIEVSFKLPREEVKEKAREILSSNLPVDDIMIDEVEAQSIIRNIFQKVDKR